MIELPLILLGGLLGSSHCLGMCGGFALMIGVGATSAKQNVWRQIVYTSGRLFTYGSLGAAAGYAGLRIAHASAWLMNSQAALCLITGVLLVGQGLFSAGVIPRRVTGRHGGVVCGAGSGLRSLLSARRLDQVFVGGMLTGLLPCGLVYAFLALATATGSVGGGFLVMTLFGLGTAPLMIAAGAGASLASVSTRRRLLTIAAWCVVATGVLTIGRGLGFVQIPGWYHGGGCPHCSAAAAQLDASIAPQDMSKI
jgi:sulfite exporter TauE/SafE